MTVSTHDYAAQLVSTARVIDVPAHDVTVPAADVYSQNMDDAPEGTTPIVSWDGWTVSAGVLTAIKSATRGNTIYEHSGGTALHFWSRTTAVASMYRTFTGLVVGREYVLSLWINPDAFNGTIGQSFWFSRDGVAQPTIALANETAFRQYFYRFTATATSHVLGLNGQYFNNFNSWLDDIVLTRSTYVTRVADHYADPATFPLAIVDGTVRLDEGAQPYMSVDLTVSRSSTALLEQMNPVNSPRVILSAAETNVGLPNHSRTFNGIVRARRLNLGDDTVTLTVASDDVLLQDDKLIAGTPDTSNLARQTSVRAICNYMIGHATGAALAAGTADADFTTLTALTNAITNGNFEVDTATWTGTNATMTWSATWAQLGTRSLAVVPSTANAGSYGASPVSLSPGNTYTASAYIRLSAALAGTLGARTRMLLVVATVGGGAVPIGESNIAPNAAGITKLTTTFTVPSNATAVEVRLCNGASTGNGNVWFDTVMLTEGNGLETDGVTPLAYFDGDTAGTATYGYAWTGTARASASTRTPVFDRGPENLWWNPGESAGEFLAPILAQAGLRLFCDETRTWQLVDNNYNPAGLVTLADAFNLYDATDTIDRSATAIDGSPLFIDAAIVKYTWTDRKGTSRVAYDFYALPSPRSSFLVEVNRPYPGPGAAKYWVTRNNGRGRALDLTARMDWSVTPSQQVAATLPQADAQVGYVSSVQWGLSSDDMSIFTRGLIQTPPTAWFYEAAGLSWDALPAGSSWANG